jgi:hypothetical protein
MPQVRVNYEPFEVVATDSLLASCGQKEKGGTIVLAKDGFVSTLDSVSLKPSIYF